MGLPTRREQAELTKALKQFAFDECPQFQDGSVGAMEVSRTFELRDYTPSGVKNPGTLEVTPTMIKLGFCATRVLTEAPKPIYSFCVRISAERMLHPREMELSDTSWRMLAQQYLDIDSVDDEGDLIDEVHTLTVEEIHDELINELIDEGIDCSDYFLTSFQCGTDCSAIDRYDERSVHVDEEVYDEVSSFGANAEYGPDEAPVITVADGKVPIIVRPKSPKRETLPGPDQIECASAFDLIVKHTGLIKAYEENTLAPHQDRVAELLYVVECLRAKRISI